MPLTGESHVGDDGSNDPPCPSTADLSSGDEDDCDDVYSCSDESSGENDD